MEQLENSTDLHQLSRYTLRAMQLLFSMIEKHLPNIYFFLAMTFFI